jgi:Domain of unknown function (DUF3482)/50S ribosome-binding GTPase
VTSASVTLSLISHTNVGKTTLARTLLRRDVGEVRDQAHVTERSERYTLAERDGAQLILWDTPGLGNTVRLMGRLRGQSNPIGWLLSQVWDRLTDRPFWSSQQAIRNARDEADAVLYLVNAAEEPEQAAYVSTELELLTWIGRPVLVVLNQTGPALPMLAGEPGAVEARRLEQTWRAHATPWPIVRDVLALDAFSRCWVQEGVLFMRLLPLMPPDKQPTLEGCAAVWRERSLVVLRGAVEQMASYLVATAADREVMVVPRPGVLGRIAALAPAASRRTMRQLRERLQTRTRKLVDALVADHGLDGHSSLKLQEHLEHFVVIGDKWLTPGTGAVVGGAVSGALGGLAADAAAAGLTFGGGAVLGAILGALGGAGLTAGYRLVQGEREPSVSWAPAFLSDLCRQTVLRYLAVSHFGRGRGGYEDFELPSRWAELVNEIQADYEASLAEIWTMSARTDPAALTEAKSRLFSVLQTLTTAVLARGYPDAAPWLMGSHDAGGRL